MSTNESPLLRVTGVSKTFGQVKALQDVGFQVMPGEVHCLMGENGAGKSTIGKIVAGVYSKDCGTIELEGKEVNVDSPATALRLGISIVMQEFNSMPDLSVYENILIGKADMYKWGFVLDKAKCIERTRELLAFFGMEQQIHPAMKLDGLSVAEQQIVEILKAVSQKSKLIILDEPTASLTSKEARLLFEIIAKLKAQGVGFIIVSHRFEEIFEISDKITVLRDGCVVLHDVNMKEMTAAKLVHAMVGRDIQNFFGEKIAMGTVEQRTMLKVEGLCDSWGFIKDLSLEAKTGEILGISGLVGAGRTTLARCIFGAERRTGKVFVDGTEIQKDSPIDAINSGIAFVTENRKEEGLFIDFPISLNSGFVKTNCGKPYVLPKKQEEADCLAMVERLNIKVGSIALPGTSLSGGNQQKVVLAKWLLTDPKVLIMDEPTRGIDISAKSEIYTIIRQLAANGVCVIIISSDLPEILGVTDRILVMRDGYVTAELDAQTATEDSVMFAASFGKAIEQQKEQVGL